MQPAHISSTALSNARFNHPHWNEAIYSTGICNHTCTGKKKYEAAQSKEFYQGKYLFLLLTGIFELF